MNTQQKEAEKKYIGPATTCASCGRKYYQLKAGSLPSELIDTYDTASVLVCDKCGRAYCMGGGLGSCAMRGCPCSPGQRTQFRTGNYVKPRPTRKEMEAFYGSSTSSSSKAPLSEEQREAAMQSMRKLKVQGAICFLLFSTIYVLRLIWPDDRPWATIVVVALAAFFGILSLLGYIVSKKLE